MDQVVEFERGTPFPGVIGRTVEESSPAWPAPLRARRGAPNVLLFVLDDVGYGQLSAFGGLVETPSIERVATAGLRYSNMHTTSLCSSARACILTGRNHHRSGVGSSLELTTGYPGYDGRLPLENGMLSEMLLAEGYNTFCVGKWHLSPPEYNTAAGPFDGWPLGRGFERFYGFLGDETNQWHPKLTLDNGSISPPRRPEEGYHLSEDLAHRAIGFIQDAHASAPGSRSSCITRRLPDTLRIRSTRSGRTRIAGASTSDGTRIANACPRASGSSVSSPRTPSSPRATEMCRNGAHCRATSGGCTPA